MKTLPIALALLLSLPLSLQAAPAGETPKTAAKPAAPESKEPKYDEKVFSGLELRGIGPALVSGRIIDLAVDPHDARIWYVAAAAGGVWKTTNAGTTFNPIFDDQGSYSIGCITIDKRN